MKFKILIVSPVPEDAHSFWRCMGPMSYLAKNSGGDIELTVTQPEDGIMWDTIAQHQLVYLHRPCRYQDLKVIQVAKNLNIPVWSDFDDWLFEMPPWNAARDIYHNQGVQSMMAHCLACSDILSTTNSALYDKFRLINPNVVIIPNSYRSDLFKYRQEIPLPRNDLFAWRGSKTHEGDLNSVLPAWKNLSVKTHFFGTTPWLVTETMKPDMWQTTSEQDFLLFFKSLYQAAPKVMLFPLADCFFNRCKSNICYIEALHAGALIVAPDMPEWKRPGVIVYKPNDADDFEKAANEAMAIPSDKLQEIVRDGFDHMKELYDAPVIDGIRIKLIQAVIDNNYEPNKRDPFDQLTAFWALSKLKGTPMVQVSPETLQKKNLTA